MYDRPAYNVPSQDRLSVTEPYYVRQPVQAVQQPVQTVQPVSQPVIRTVNEDSIERPNEKNVPKFAQMLKNLGRKRNGD